MVVCAVKGCESTSRKNNNSKRISFHRFPTDPHIKKDWIAATQRGPNFEPSVFDRVCSLHFDESDFLETDSTYRSLLKYAVPKKKLCLDVKPEVHLLDSQVKTKGTSTSRSSSEKVLACRVCFVTDVKLVQLKDYLAEAFSDITGIKVLPTDGLLQYLCVICATQLRKLVQFRNKCYTAQSMLEEALGKGIKITKQFIKTLDRQSYELCHALTINKLPNISMTGEDIQVMLDDEQYETNNEEEIREDNEDIGEESPIHEGYETNNEEITYEDDNNIGGETPDSCANEEHLDFLFLEDEDDDNEMNNELDDIIDEKYFEIDNGNLLEFHNKRKARGDRTRKKNKKDITEDAIADMEIKKWNGITMADIEDDEVILKREVKQAEELVVKKKKKQRIKKKKRKAEEMINIEDYEELANMYDFDIYFLTLKEQIAEVQARKESNKYKMSKFKCEVCFQGYEREMAFKHHKLRHNLSAGRHKCDICGIRFLRRPGLMEHAHKHKTTFVCKLCRKSFKYAGNMKAHFEWHNELANTCQVSEELLMSGSDHADGISDYDPLEEDEEDHLKCASSKRSFNTKKGKTSEDSLPERLESAMCEVCGWTADCELKLKEHQLVHSEDKPHKCTECPETFRLAEMLRVHMYKHTGNYPHKCAVCDEAFPFESLLRKHNQEHKKMQPCLCQHCGETFHSSYSAQVHIDTVHSNVQ